MTRSPGRSLLKHSSDSSFPETTGVQERGEKMDVSKNVCRGVQFTRDAQSHAIREAA